MGRRSIRLPKYDYTQLGVYFVTICTLHQLSKLGRIEEGEIVLSQEGEIVSKCLDRIPHHFENSTLGIYTIMPNHIHMIVILSRGEASAKDGVILPLEPKVNDSPLHQGDSRPRGTKKGSLGAIIQNFKSVSTRKINQLRRTSRNRIWQRKTFEHIIRTERALNAMRRYIMSNPARWEMDRYNPQLSGSDSEVKDLWNLLREDVISQKVTR